MQEFCNEMLLKKIGEQMRFRKTLLVKNMNLVKNFFYNMGVKFNGTPSISYRNLLDARLYFSKIHDEIKQPSPVEFADFVKQSFFVTSNQ